MTKEYAMAQVLGRFTQWIAFGDPIFHLNLPFVLRSPEQLKRYATWVLPRLCQVPYSKLYSIDPERDLHAPRGVKYFQTIFLEYPRAAGTDDDYLELVSRWELEPHIHGYRRESD